MSRLMLNLHSSASTGILSATSVASSGVAFTSRVPDDLPFTTNRNDTDFELQATMPTQSLQAGATFIVEETAHHEIEMEPRNDS
jgi:hypothetical protein